MRIAMLIPPYRYGADPTQWITVPPQGYGGIQWVAATLIDGLLQLGDQVLLLGAPGSPTTPGLTVSKATTRAEVWSALDAYRPDVVHDHSNADLLPVDGRWPTVTTHHLNGVPANRDNGIYVSRAQRRIAGSANAPVIPLPVNPDRCHFSTDKQEYLLFLGRVSAHKGALEAAEFASAAEAPLKIAGPAWERDYLDAVLAVRPKTTEYLGEIGGSERTQLLAGARSLLVFSQTLGGPFGGRWSEPGATVVAEAAASGTPVIASDNGCLPEIVPGVGAVIPEATPVTYASARRTLASLPTAEQTRSVALDRWGHLTIAAQYQAVYRRAAGGGVWT
jgi:glycosyltransferase involved in cell wall biosynthesis